jgi:peptidoglycan/LPS O-acetylase OafA/YrhL
MVRDKAMFYQAMWWLTGIGAILVTAACQELGFFAGRGEVAWASTITILWIWPLSALMLADKWLCGFSPQWWWGFIKALQICGQFSYSLYLLHMPLMYLRNLLWSDIHSGILRFAIWLGGFFAILGISWLSYQLFEKPFIQYRFQERSS